MRKPLSDECIDLAIWAETVSDNFCKAMHACCTDSRLLLLLLLLDCIIIIFYK